MYFKIPVNFYQKFEIRKLSWKNLDEVMAFVIKYYSPRSPVGKIFRERLEETQAFDVLRLKDKLKNSICFGGYEKGREKIIGVNFGTIHKDVMYSPCPTAECLKDMSALPLSEQFFQWFEKDLLERLNVKKIMLSELGALHPDHTGKGITEAFLKHLVDAAIETKCEVLVSSAVSLYSQKKLEKLGFSLLKEIKYSDWIDPRTGKKPDLNPSPVDSHVKIYYIRV